MTKQYPKPKYTGTVGVTGMDTGRFNEFSLSLGRLELPPFWEVVGALNYDENHARNYLVEHTKGDFIWFIDDDQAFSADVLKNLLSHGVDVVAPLVLQRRAPFAPVAIKDGYHLILNDQKPGLIQVDKTGTSGMLIRRSVFESLEKPYFVSRDLDDGTHIPSDTNFCNSLADAGIPIHVDTSVTLAHFNVVSVSPRYDQTWKTDFAIGNERVFTLDNNLKLWRLDG